MNNPSQGQAGTLLRMFLSLSKNVVPGLGRLIDALPLFFGAIGQRSISAEMILVSSVNLVMQPVRVTLPIPSITKPPSPHLVKL
jgi:hypothetical protein